MVDTDRDKLAQSGGKFAHYLCKILDVYFSYHRDSYCMKGVYLHDPTALLAAVNPSLITYTEGIVRVQTIGITRGLTLFYNKQKRVKEHFGTERERAAAAAAEAVADEPRGREDCRSNTPDDPRTFQTTHEPQRERETREP
ncbi:probable uridine nucleosidase 2 isoform X1 [Camellia sinensis]|uniref:probable uridine nucleosidase 2 isoform X1 n=1 Tax=Camellia sinensis TaxID=4442 RepID=UPI001035D71D|nr:probable uridine nucleosidase 2 isoform X1 [Camellia sinensis]